MERRLNTGQAGGGPMTRTRTLTGLVFLLVLGFAPALPAQSTAPVQYFYDDLG